MDLSKSQLKGLAEGQEPLTRGVRELNVSENLIKDWDTVTNICQHLPRLRSLTVSGNRKLRAPGSNDGSQVRPQTPFLLFAYYVYSKSLVKGFSIKGLFERLKAPSQSQ